MEKLRNRPVRAALCLGLLLCFALALGLPAQTANNNGDTDLFSAIDPHNYVDQTSAVIYDSTNGLPTNGVNDIAQTKEGFLWIGSYCGLIRYDGNYFELLDASSGLSSIESLFVDSQDRLWIGTNDSGLALMAVIRSSVAKSFSETTRTRVTGCVSRNSAVRSFSSLQSIPAARSAEKNAPPRPSTLPHSMA